jgi:uncharacterized protein (TIGR03083 family)
MADEMEVLGASVARLREVVDPFGPEQLRDRAYPSEWNVADVLSHLGSAAEIYVGWIEHALGGDEVEAQPIWDAWNAKDPDTKAADALRADRALMERLDSVSEAERDRFTFAMGPLNVDFAGFVRLRINEHTVHTWDVAVASDASATLQPTGVPIVLEALPMIAGFVGKPTGSARELRLHTTEPDRHFVIDLRADGVSFATDHEPVGTADLELPAEALVRLVYGRLDPGHTPAFSGAPSDLDELRRAFPGV